MHARLQHSCCPVALPGTRRSPMPQRCCIVRCLFQHGQLSVKAIVYFPSPSGDRWCSVGFRLALVLPESPLSSGRKISSCLLTYLPQEGTADAESKIPFVENPELTNCLPLMTGVGQNIATRALPAARNFFLFLISTFPVYLAVFQILSVLFNCVTFG